MFFECENELRLAAASSRIQYGEWGRHQYSGSFDQYSESNLTSILMKILRQDYNFQQMSQFFAKSCSHEKGTETNILFKTFF